MKNEKKFPFMLVVVDNNWRSIIILIKFAHATNILHTINKHAPDYFSIPFLLFDFMWGSCHNKALIMTFYHSQSTLPLIKLQNK